MKTKKILSTVLALLIIISALSSVSYAYYDGDCVTLSTNGVWQQGFIGNGNELDWYKIVIPSDGKITIKITHYGTLEGYMYNSDYSSCLWNGSYILNGGYNSEGLSGGTNASPVTSTITRVLSKGTYFISVNKYKDYSNNYKISVTYNSYGTNETEPNDFETAMPVNSNQKIIGAFTQQDDVDWFKIYIPQKINVTIKIQHYMTMEWYLYDQDLSNCILDGSIIVNGGYNVNGLRGGSETSPVTNSFDLVLSKGYYYIKLQKRDVGKYSLLWNIKLSAPTPKVANKNGYVSVTWSKSAGAKGYYVYRKAAGATSWTRIANVTGTSYNDKNVKSGTNYTYTVKAYNGSTYSSFHSGVTIKYLAQTAPKVANKNGNVTVTWNKISGAKGYYVYRKGPNDKSWKRIGNVTGTSYVDKNIKSGTNYTYTVKAYNGSTYSAYNAGISIKYLAQPAFKVANKSKNVTVTWGKVAGAKGYYVYRKAGNATSWTRIANVTGTSYVDKNVKKNVKYTYTVKAYNGKFNSAYHKGVTVKH